MSAVLICKWTLSHYDDDDDDDDADVMLCGQECDDGYKRSGGGFYLGTCDRCECHGHADRCGEIDGLCIVSEAV